MTVDVSTRFLFFVHIPTFELSTDEIWPDGGGPKNPTAQDVVSALKEYGSIDTVVRDWNLNLGTSIDVTRLGAPLDNARYMP